MTGPHPQAQAEVVEQWNGGREEKAYYVMWMTDSAYGSRGNGMTREAAEQLAARIRLHGPRVGFTVPEPWVVL